MQEIYLHIGSNKGDRAFHLRKTRELIATHLNPITVSSSVYETEAWGVIDQPDFYNQVIVSKTYLSPLDLLKRIQKIEAIIGKQKEFHWGPRNIDIDILLYGNKIIEHPRLTIPHILMTDRRFVLIPLCEITTRKIHPTKKKTMAELLEICPDKSKVLKLNIESAVE